MEALFESEVKFQIPNGAFLDGGVLVGSTEFLPVQVLRDDDEAWTSEFDDWLNLDWTPRQTELREQFLEATDCLQRFEDLCDAVTRRVAVPLVGAGMSVASGLPSWADLLRRVVSSVTHDSAQLESLLSSGHFEEAAQFAADVAGAGLLQERIEHALRLPKGTSISGPVCLLPEVFRDLVITTNMDEVVEAAYFEYVTDRLPSLKGPGIAKFQSMKGTGPHVLKLHGDRTDPSSHVLLPTQYEESYGVRGTVRTPLELLYQTQTVVFMGCSLVSDRTLRLLGELAASKTEMPRHYALLALPPRESERSAREVDLTARGVYPIWYSGTHDDAIFALLDGLRVAAEGTVT